jgi:hypothetical protein
MDMRVRSERGNVSASGRRLRLSFVAIVTLLVLVISACANDAPTAGVLTTDEPVADNLRTYAGAISDDLFIGIALATDPDEEVQQQAVMVYLCDGNELSVWLADEFTGQEVTLARGDISVTLTITENEISGTVSMNGVLSQSLTAARSTTVSLANVEPDRFTAERGTGDAGLYRAEGTFDGMDHVGGWIILNDGRQLGAVTVDGAVVENPTLDTATGEATFSGETLIPSALYFCPPWPLHYCLVHR